MPNELDVKKQDEALAALSAGDRDRLQRLTVLARINPEDIWSEVWQYGFEDVEDSVQAELDADEDVKAAALSRMKKLWRRLH